MGSPTTSKTQDVRLASLNVTQIAIQFTIPPLSQSVLPKPAQW